MEYGLETREIHLGSSKKKLPTSEDVSHASTELINVDGVEMSEMSDTSCGIGRSSISAGFVCCSVMGAGDIGLIALKGMISILRSLTLGGVKGCCLP